LHGGFELGACYNHADSRRSGNEEWQMKIAVTGGTGFIGRHLAAGLVSHGHHVVLVARGVDHSDSGTVAGGKTDFVAASIDDPTALAAAFGGCESIAHCAGINRETGTQSYHGIHVEGTRNVVTAAKAVGAKKVVLLSFLRARPDCGSNYHESKWQAEQIIRNSGLDHTIIKAGVVYGAGDHLISHVRLALRALPVFATVGINDRSLRPLAVEDLVSVVEASLVDGRLSRQTVAAIGPEELSLKEVVSRIARAGGRHALIFPAPVFFHKLLASILERLTNNPMVSTAQVRMLAEGISEPLPPCDSLPTDLAPSTYFTERQILKC
jgi:uncharacterized protein YbjT (DUF2867 family)